MDLSGDLHGEWPRQVMPRRLELGVGRRVQLRKRAMLDTLLHKGPDDR